MTFSYKEVKNERVYKEISSIMTHTTHKTFIRFGVVTLLFIGSEWSTLGILQLIMTFVLCVETAIVIYLTSRFISFRKNLKKMLSSK